MDKKSNDPDTIPMAWQEYLKGTNFDHFLGGRKSLNDFNINSVIL